MFDPHLFSSPLSLLLAVILILLIILADRYWTALQGTRIWCLTPALLLLFAVLMGVDGTWGLGLQHHPAFVAVALLLVFTAGVYAFQACRTRHPASSLLPHLGFFLLVFGAFWSGADFKEYSMALPTGEAAYMATDSRGNEHPLPFRVALEEFRVDFYPDGVSPKQYTSELVLDGERRVFAGVNHPARHKGWMIYQAGFDKDRPGVTVLRFVRDPWLPLIFAGMLLMAAGALMGIWRSWHSKWTLPVMLALAVAFGAISLARINFGTLMPALRSFWFIPHLIIYMLAYSMLAIASVLSVVCLVRPQTSSVLRDRLLSCSSSLLLLGMLCGAVWAKMAWGDWWAWDPKENWAAVTWMVTLVATHWPEKLRKDTIVPILIIFAFAAMQITWYGVDYLPSAGASLHAYK